MIYFETEEGENGDDVSKTLFTHLYAGNDEYDGDDDEDEEVTSLESSAEILMCLDEKPCAVKEDVRQGDQTSHATSRSSMKPSLFLSQLLGVSIFNAESFHFSQLASNRVSTMRAGLTLGFCCGYSVSRAQAKDRENLR